MSKEKELLSLPKTEIKSGFLDETILLPIEKIVPTRTVAPGSKRSSKYKAILSSIKEVGVIEPPVVTPHDKSGTRYILLDGHLRLEALKDLGKQEIVCLVSTDDESFTYNRHVSRLPAVQEHTMIMNGLKRGMSEEKIALALNVDVGSIKSKRDLLNGICPDVVDLLKEKPVAAGVFSILRKMLPMRQLEAADIMIKAELYSVSFATSILHTTPKSLLVNPEKVRLPKGYSEEFLASMEREREMTDREYRLIAETLDRDIFYLIVAQGWLGKIIGNDRVRNYLSKNHSDIASQFQRIINIKSLGTTTQST